MGNVDDYMLKFMAAALEGTPLDLPKDKKKSKKKKGKDTRKRLGKTGSIRSPSMPCCHIHNLPRKVSYVSAYAQLICTAASRVLSTCPGRRQYCPQ
ncbi:hypothetical protein VTK73DRAFT_9109 [Phialemonium thermophilum]|uniref:Uncharacterized protein n=1 Tax=Phialemonium thermophilum TaxID=223376 RepID=A0ABR3W4N1_9PEZI